MHIGFAQLFDKLEFDGMSAAQYLPPGGKVPQFAFLGRMRNGDMFRICMHFVKKVHWKSLYRLICLHSKE